MAFDYARLLNTGSIIAYIPAASGSVYTHVTGSITTTYVRNIIVHNTHTGDEAIQIWVVPSGSVPSTALTPYRFYNESLASGNTRMIEFAIPGIVMKNHGESIWAGVPDQYKVTIMIFGGQE